jgi:ferredoxin
VTRVHVDPDLCVGTAECVRIAPAAFELDRTRGVSMAREGAPSVERELLDEAAYACPTRAITVEDES